MRIQMMLLLVLVLVSHLFKTNLADLPVLGAFLDGATLTTGYETSETSTIANTSDAHDLTAALTYSIGDLSRCTKKTPQRR